MKHEANILSIYAQTDGEAGMPMPEVAATAYTAHLLIFQVRVFLSEINLIHFAMKTVSKVNTSVVSQKH